LVFDELANAPFSRVVLPGHFCLPRETRDYLREPTFDNENKPMGFSVINLLFGGWVA
jgi:hypothetical protein